MIKSKVLKFNKMESFNNFLVVLDQDLQIKMIFFHNSKSLYLYGILIHELFILSLCLFNGNNFYIYKY